MIPRVNAISIQAWLESYSSSVPVAETAFPPRDALGKANRIKVPFIVFLDDIEPEGGDLTNLAKLHDVTIEYYCEDGNDSGFTKWLYDAGLKFTRTKTYIQNEQLYLSTYSLNEILIEKETRLDGSSE